MRFLRLFRNIYIPLYYSPVVMKYSELYDQALRSSFAAVKRDINDVKAKNSLIDEKLKNSFSNIKKDMDYLKESIEELKARKPIELDGFNERLSRIESAVEDIKNDYFKDTGELDISGDLDSIKSQLKALDEAAVSKGDIENAVNSLKDELDIDSKLKELEKKISKPVINEVVKKASKKKGEKGTFSKMIDFFAED